MTVEIELPGHAVSNWLKATQGELGYLLIGCLVDDGEYEDNWYVIDIQENYSLTLACGVEERDLPYRKLSDSIFIVSDENNPILDHVSLSPHKSSPEEEDAARFLRENGFNPHTIDSKDEIIAAARIVKCHSEGNQPTFDDGKLLQKHSIPRMNSHHTCEKILLLWLEAIEDGELNLFARLLLATFYRRIEKPRRALTITEPASNSENGMIHVSRAACFLDIGEIQQCEVALESAFSFGGDKYADEVWKKLQKRKGEYINDF